MVNKYLNTIKMIKLVLLAVFCCVATSTHHNELHHLHKLPLENPLILNHLKHHEIVKVPVPPISHHFHAKHISTPILHHHLHKKEAGSYEELSQPIIKLPEFKSILPITGLEDIAFNLRSKLDEIKNMLLTGHVLPPLSRNLEFMLKDLEEKLLEIRSILGLDLILPIKENIFPKKPLLPTIPNQHVFLTPLGHTLPEESSKTLTNIALVPQKKVVVPVNTLPFAKHLGENHALEYDVHENIK